MAVDCVLTTNKLTEEGYGKTSATRYGKRIWRTHQRAWIDAHGRLPAEGMQICHTCDNPPCVNPEHLYEGTPRQNTQDALDRGRHSWSQNAPKAWESYRSKTACRNGHPYTDENTYRRPDGARGCRTCRQDAGRRHRARQKEG